MTLRIESLSGDALQASLGSLAQLRIEVFRDFPYLYDGDLDYERKYLAAFARSRNSVIVGAFDGDSLVGAATAAPLADQSPEIQAPFDAAGVLLSDYFYFGESVLRPKYRGHGVGVKFFEHRERQARRSSAKICTFCAVVREPQHPLRPVGYQPLDDFWRHRGYALVPGRYCEISWREMGQAAETAKRMQFWERRLEP